MTARKIAFGVIYSIVIVWCVVIPAPLIWLALRLEEDRKP
jgi:hypothetical protein